MTKAQARVLRLALDSAIARAARMRDLAKRQDAANPMNASGASEEVLWLTTWVIPNLQDVLKTASGDMTDGELRTMYNLARGGAV